MPPTEKADPQHLIEQLLTQIRSSSLPYHVVVVADDPAAGKVGVICVGDLTVEAAMALLGQYVGTKCQAFVFRGERCFTTGYPFHLVTPDGTFPIVAVDASATPDPSGWLGMPEAQLAMAAEAAEAGGVADASAIIGPVEDDDEDDEDEELDEEEVEDEDDTEDEEED